MLSISAFNALLKTLEEPPPHARFMLATTEPHKIPATIISRCQRFDLRRIAVPEIVNHLRHIAQEEGFGAENEALTAIARSAQGCMRDAISLLDQMLSYGNETITFFQVQQALGAVSAQAVNALVDALATRKVAAGLTLIQQLVLEGASLPEFCHQVVEHLRGVMVLQMTDDRSLLSDLPGETLQQMATQAKQMGLATTLTAIKRFSSAVAELKGGHQPQLPLELALIEAIQGEIMPAPIAVPQVVVAAPAIAAPPPITPAEVVPTATPVATSPADSKPATVTPPAVEVAAEPPPLDEAAVQRLRSQWEVFKQTVKARDGVRVLAAINTVRDIAVADQTVAFAFGNNQFTRDMLADPEINGKVAGILSSLLSRPVKLDCQMGDHARLLNMVAIHGEQNDGADPLLEYALSTLGAEVVE